MYHVSLVLLLVLSNSVSAAGLFNRTGGSAGDVITTTTTTETSYGSAGGNAGVTGGSAGNLVSLRGRFQGHLGSGRLLGRRHNETTTTTTTTARRNAAGPANHNRKPAASRQAPAAPVDEKPAVDAKAPDKSADLSNVESRLVAGINQLRAADGRPPLAVDPILERVARERANAVNPNSPHDSPQYGSAMRHAARYANWRSVSDVCAGAHWSDGSQATPEESCDGWRRSPGHYKCILGLCSVNGRYVDQRFDRIGVARGKRWDIAVFGRRESETNCGCLQGGKCTCGSDCRCRD